MTNRFPQIIGFEKMGITDNATVASFIKENIPSDHVACINEIRYEDKYMSLVGNQSLDKLLVSGLNITSQWSFDPSTSKEMIEIFRQDIDGSSDKNKLFEDLAHEIAHSVFYHLAEDAEKAYKVLWKENLDGYNTRAKNSVEEHFCYSYSLFILNKEELNQRASSILQFMSSIQ